MKLAIAALCIVPAIAFAPRSASFGTRHSTLNAVATALAIDLRDASLEAEGDLDFRGTLGLSKDVPVGFQNIRLQFTLDTDASDEQLDTLLRLTERYCVVFQTLAQAPQLAVSRKRNS